MKLPGHVIIELCHLTTVDQPFLYSDKNNIFHLSGKLAL